jgi:hypothetical protein
MFKIEFENNVFGVENIYDNIKNITRFDIYLSGQKQFSIEPTILYGHGEEILWKLSDEYKNLKIDPEMIEKLGNAIENFIN